MNRVGKFRWVICALLFSACLINYMDRQVLGLLKPKLSVLFNWTETDYGHMAIAFQAAYAIGQTLFGPFINWVGTRSAYAFSVVFWGRFFGVAAQKRLGVEPGAQNRDVRLRVFNIAGHARAACWQRLAGGGIFRARLGCSPRLVGDHVHRCLRYFPQKRRGVRGWI